MVEFLEDLSDFTTQGDSERLSLIATALREILEAADE